MRCDVLTIFPELIGAYLDTGIIGKARQKGIIDVSVSNIREFASGKHKETDDYPFGGGPGMVFKPEPIFKAVEKLREDGRARKVILLTPQGRVFDQAMAEAFSKEEKRLVFICGRYEGIDERVRISLVDEEVSIGDYVLTGGELAALVIIDAVARLFSGVLGDESSKEAESFSWGPLDYPHYTRPREFRGLEVPEVLISGNHKEIERWRRKEALRKTLEMRPELLERIKLGELDKKLISEIEEEQ
ncbi:MAG: tRNA (guanosine(37)-N1)-methyltransferase TrmD [Nitrospirae bacterium]|nr:tRNA (guanosine(37)-N1)-methyltransferase TrmD [Nitrospirota bacterium]